MKLDRVDVRSGSRHVKYLYYKDCRLCRQTGWGTFFIDRSRIYWLTVRVQHKIGILQGESTGLALKEETSGRQYAAVSENKKEKI